MEETKISTIMPKTPGKRNTPTRSQVWQYITCDIDAKVARCNICNKTMKYTGGTTNLRYHLTASHQMQEFEVSGPSARVYKEGGEWKTGRRVRTIKSGPTFRVGGSPSSKSSSRGHNVAMPSTSASGTIAKITCGPERSKFIHSHVVMLLAQSLLPVSMVEDEGFIRFIQEMEPGYPMLGKKVAQSMLMGKYEEAQEKLKICLNKDAKNFGLVYEIWTGHDKNNYLTVTIHYLTHQWNRESWVLGTDRVSTKPSTTEINMCIRNLISQYQLSLESITAVVNRQGILKVTQINKVGEALLCDSMSCATEKLEHCVSMALLLPSVKVVVEGAAKMINYFLHNEDPNEKLNKAKAESKLNIELQDYNKSSWLGIADMLQKVLALQDEIESVKAQDEKNQLMYLHDWEGVAQLVHSLQILKAALTVLGDQKSGSVACVLPVVHSMLQHCEGREDDGSMLSEFLTVIAKEVREKWDLNAIMPSSVTMLSALLDPRFKQLKFIADDDKLDVIDALKQLVVANHATANHDSEDSATNSVSPFLCLFGEDEFNSKPETTDAEVTTYLSYPPLSRDMCPLDWWRMNQGKFPELSKIARCYLAVPAVVQSWSDIITGSSKMDMKRALLDVDTAGPLIFLNKNWSILS
ncbi:E3 SUMO-protein ligase ZBED1-like isoform X1 [Lytechinus pictus]|uniref:E3 SUMO-protein ligase ZBED1-like isoform X1 n=2 Tax=Lytechinus pictus TaxID=7653 RepID=UPI0030B9FFDC